MFRFQKILGCLVLFLIGSVGYAADSKVLPELQVYHSFGAQGSSYSTVAGGLAIQLSVEQRGSVRWLQLLGLYSPEQTFNRQSKAGEWLLESDGQGFEIGLYDQKQVFDYFQGANTALRHLEWEKARSGDVVGKVSADVLHLGWALGTTLMFLWGIDFASIQTPKDHLFEIQLILGSRFAF